MLKDDSTVRHRGFIAAFLMSFAAKATTKVHNEGFKLHFAMHQKYRMLLAFCSHTLAKIASQKKSTKSVLHCRYYDMQTFQHVLISQSMRVWLQQLLSLSRITIFFRRFTMLPPVGTKMKDLIMWSRAVQGTQRCAIIEWLWRNSTRAKGVLLQKSLDVYLTQVLDMTRREWGAYFER